MGAGKDRGSDSPAGKAEKSVRMRSQLPTYLRFERVEKGDDRMQFICECGEAEMGKARPHVGEDGSSAEMRCSHCGRYIQVRSSREV